MRFLYQFDLGNAQLSNYYVGFLKGKIGKNKKWRNLDDSSFIVHVVSLFEDKEIIGTQLVALFSGFLFDWSGARGFTNTSYIPEFIESLSLCT